MTDEPFDIDGELSQKASEARAAAMESEAKLRKNLAWSKETGATDSIRLGKMPDPYIDAFRQFVARGGKVRWGKSIWLPPEHPEYGKVGLDESCMKVPQLESVKGDTDWIAGMRHKKWEAECAQVRAEIAKTWDLRFPKAYSLEFVEWEYEGANKYGYVIFDERDSNAYYFSDRYHGHYYPTLEEFRKKLVDELYSQILRGEAEGPGEKSS